MEGQGGSTNVSEAQESSSLKDSVNSARTPHTEMFVGALSRSPVSTAKAVLV